MTEFTMARNKRRENITNVGRFKGGKLMPVVIHPVRPSEGGMLSQSITFELDPIAGRMITPMTGELITVFVPVQAVHAIANPTVDYAGLTEVIRQQMLSGAPLFGLTDETTISKRLNVIPAKVGGINRISSAVHLSHNAAVNFLRQRKHHAAELLLAGNTNTTPALLGTTILDRLNGVLDPDDHINGSVQLDIPDMQLPVANIGVTGAAPVLQALRFPDNSTVSTQTKELFVSQGSSAATVAPHIYAQLNGAATSSVSLAEFYNAEKSDERVRQMRAIIDANPTYGEEMVLRWAHGLSVDPGKTPILLAERTAFFGRNLVGATDSLGVESDIIRSDMALTLSILVPVPKTELGGFLLTFAVLKPDEVLANMPHPILTQPWGLDNFLADEQAIDPVPVTLRQLDCNITSAQENTVMFYTGLNEHKRNYVNYGFNRQVNPDTVENKTAIWQLPIPLSVTADNILYPELLTHFPFQNQYAEVCTYSITSNLVLGTPMIFGPTPVEQLAIIDSADLFEE